MRAGHRGSLVAALLAAACSTPRNPENGPVTSQAAGECAAVIGAPSDSIPLSSIVGTFRLTLVATSGARSGHTVRGDLRLETPSSADRGTGSVAIALDSVGARAPGTTRDGRHAVESLRWSAAPGAPRTTIRIGVLDSPSGTQVIEGSYTALTVTRALADGFAGTWESGMPDGSGMARGHFCADRGR